MGVLSSAQMLELKEICEMCFFSSEEEIENFWCQVHLAGDTFEQLHTKAKEILLNEGIKVFRPRHR